MAYRQTAQQGHSTSQVDLQGGYDAPYGNPFSDSNQNIPLSSTNYGGHGAQSMSNLTPYRDAPGSSVPPPQRNDNWMESGYNERSDGTGKRRWIIIGVVVVALIIAGVVVGVTLSKKNSTNTSSGDSNSSGSSSTVPQTNPNDPSTFTKNPDLHQVFWGFAYTPEGAIMPDCGAKLENVITDIQLLSQLTTRLRLYGADCNVSALVLEAIQQTKVDMEVYLGNFVTSDSTAYTRQRDTIKSAIQTYGTKSIAGITVGNEFMLNYLNDHASQDPNSAVGDEGAAVLIANIQDTRQMLTSLNLDKTIPVGNSDAGAFFNNKVLAAIDYGMANVHPWFANVTIDVAASWTWDFFENTDIAQANQVPNKPTMYIAETGWPTKSKDAGNANNGASDASIPNLQKFLDTFVCQANANGTGYFFFEYFDEKWKDDQFGGVEGYWGVFNGDRTLKDLKFPTCQ